MSPAVIVRQATKYRHALYRGLRFPREGLRAYDAAGAVVSSALARLRARENARGSFRYMSYGAGRWLGTPNPRHDGRRYCASCGRPLLAEEKSHIVGLRCKSCRGLYDCLMGVLDSKAGRWT